MLPIPSLLSLCCLPKNLKIKVRGTLTLSVILYLRSNSGNQNYQNQCHLTKVRFPFPIATEHHLYILIKGDFVSFTELWQWEPLLSFQNQALYSKDMCTKR